jgi:hypothetical protein
MAQRVLYTPCVHATPIDVSPDRKELKEVKEFQNVYSKWFITFLAGVLIGLVLAGCDRFASRSSTVPDDSINANTENPDVVGGQLLNRRTSKISKSVARLELRRDEKAFVDGSCTATFIGPSTALTAAHCFDHVANDQVFLNFALSPETPAKNILRRVLQWSKHPQFNTEPWKKYVWDGSKYVLTSDGKPGRAYDHDLAVVSFEGGLPPGAMSVDLDDDASRIMSGEKILFFGYGTAVDTGKPASSKVEFLRRRDLRIGSATILNDGQFDLSSDHFFHDGEGPNYICQGDSGGPEFFADASDTRIIGVTSTSDGPFLPAPTEAGTKLQSCIGKGKAIRVAVFADWIRGEEKRLVDTMTTK